MLLLQTWGWLIFADMPSSVNTYGLFDTHSTIDQLLTKTILISFPAQSGNELEHEEVPPHSCILSELLSGILMLLISVSVWIRRALRHICWLLSVYAKYCDNLYWASLMSLFTVFMFGREIVVEKFKLFDDTGKLNLPSRRIRKKLFSQVNFSDLSE